MVRPLDFPTLEELREEFLAIIDDHLSRLSIVPRVIFGDPFDFMQSRIVALSSGVRATTLAEFRTALASVHPSAIYFHTIEAPRRLGRPETDFAAWLREGLGLPGLAEAMSRTDPYSGSLERLRMELLHLCDLALETSHGPR